jgi:hypothetical protein
MCGFRPTEASEAVVSYVRNTSSIRDGAQTSQMRN